MKKFIIEVKGASAGQLQTIALELKIMSNGWTKHGPRIRINGKPLEAPSLTMEAPSSKLQAASARHEKDTIM
jgi:hypothetical protein